MAGMRLQKKKSLDNLEAATGPGTFLDLLHAKETAKLRDPYVLFDFAETDGRYQIGYAIIYPSCRTGGHIHEDAEEIFHIVDGQGQMTIGEESFPIKPGDTYIVPVHQVHFLECTGKVPMKIFWAVCKL